MSMQEEMSKKFGGGICTASDKREEYKKTEWLDTGSYVLNAAINYKARGFPTGNMIESFGASTSGKSVMAYHVLRNTIEKDGIAVLIDVEGAYDYDLGEAIGIDSNKLIIIDPTVRSRKKKKKTKKSKKVIEETEEEENEEKPKDEDILSPLTLLEVYQRTEWLIQETRKQYGEDKLLTIVWDTLAATACDEDLEGDTPSTTMGNIQRRNKQWIKRIRPVVNATNTLWLIINQVYSNISLIPTAEPLLSPGGKAVGFNSHIRVKWISRKGKAGKIETKDPGFPIGARLHFKVEKNRVGPPWRSGAISFYFGSEGRPILDYWSGYLDYLIKLKVVTTGRGKVIIGEDSYQARKNGDFYETEFMDKILKEHPELLEVKK